MPEPIRIELPTVFGMKTVNSYLFLEPEPTLVDCGEKTGASWHALQKALGKHNLTIKDIARIYITHAHIDHMGMAGEIVKHSDATVWVSEYVYNWAVNLEIEQQKRRKLIQSVIEKNIDLNTSSFGRNFSSLFSGFKEYWDVIPEDRVLKFELNGYVKLGGEAWEVVYAPGHCINQTCFYHPDSGQLLSADMLLMVTPSPVIEASLHPPYEREKSLAVLLDSYEKFSKMDIARVYPGHYESYENVKELIQSQVQRIHNRKEVCFDLIQSGKHTFMELLNELYKNRVSFPAVPMLVGYLDLLLEEGRIFNRKENGIFTYHAA